MARWRDIAQPATPLVFQLKAPKTFRHKMRNLFSTSSVSYPLLPFSFIFSEAISLIECLSPFSIYTFHLYVSRLHYCVGSPSISRPLHETSLVHSSAFRNISPLGIPKSIWMHLVRLSHALSDLGYPNQEVFAAELRPSNASIG